MIIVNIPKSLASIDQVPVQFHFDATTLNDILEIIKHNYPSLYNRVTNNGQISPFVAFYCNGELVEDLDAPLSDNEEITLLYAIAGG